MQVGMAFLIQHYLDGQMAGRNGGVPYPTLKEWLDGRRGCRDVQMMARGGIPYPIMQGWPDGR